jgi:hypothetical protein
MADSKIYLGKGGKFVGPFSPSDIEQMRKTGAIFQYVWIWEEQKGAWATIELPPPPPPTEAGAKSSGAKAHMPSEWDVICHDRKTAVSGQLRNLSDSGAFFLATGSSLSPALVRGAMASLSLVDKKSGNMLNHPVRIVDVSRDTDGCVYQMSWDRSPEL